MVCLFTFRGISMLFGSIIATCGLIFSTLVSANIQKAHPLNDRNLSSKCSKELAEIIYSPVTPAQVYLANVAAELKVEIGAMLNQVSNADYGLLSNFLQKYKVSLSISTFFGTSFTFFMTDSGIGSAGGESSFSQTLSRLGLAYDSFRYEPVLDLYFYGFVVQSSSTATGAIVTIELPARSGAFSPVGC